MKIKGCELLTDTALAGVLRDRALNKPHSAIWLYHGLTPNFVLVVSSASLAGVLLLVNLISTEDVEINYVL